MLSVNRPIIPLLKDGQWYAIGPNLDVMRVWSVLGYVTAYPDRLIIYCVNISLYNI